MQDILGEVHDLDVLRPLVRKQASGMDPKIIADWMAKIEKERKSRLEEFRTQYYR